MHISSSNTKFDHKTKFEIRLLTQKYLEDIHW